MKEEEKEKKLLFVSPTVENHRSANFQSKCTSFFSCIVFERNRKKKKKKKTTYVLLFVGLSMPSQYFRELNEALCTAYQIVWTPPWFRRIFFWLSSPT